MSLTKEHLRDLAANPTFISGIYNSCDRWCERCHFSSRCLKFATLREQDVRADDDKIDLADANEIDQKAIDHVTEIFGITAEMIEEIAQEDGIDLTDVKPLPKAPPNTLSCRAKKYYGTVDSWMSRYEIPLAVCIEQDERQIGIINERSSSSGTVRARLEVWTRQGTLIALKVARAFEHHAPEASDEGDANGSAKAALVAIDEPIGARLSIVKFIDHPFAKKESRNLAESLEELSAPIEYRGRGPQLYKASF